MNELEDIAGNINPTGNLSLILSTVWVILNNYAESTKSTITIGQFASTDKSNFYHNDLIEEILKRTTKYENDMNLEFFIGDGNIYEINSTIYETATEDELFMKHFRNKDKGIWLIDSLKSFTQLEDTLLRTHNYFQRLGFFTIIYTGNESNVLENITQIFHRLFYIYVININILVLTNQKVEVYTYFPFKPNMCNSIIPKLYLTFDGNVENKNSTFPKTFFPDKLSNMYGCDMVVTTTLFRPFIYIGKIYEPQKLDQLDGIEGLILTLISKKLNFTIRVLPQSVTDFDHVSLSGNITEAMKMIIEGTSNIAIGGYIYNKMHSSIMQATFPYMSSSVYIIIPKGRQISPFERLAKPFANIIWICLGFSILFAMVIIFGVKLFCKIEVFNFIFGQRNRLPFTNLWSTLYGIGLHRIPGRNFARYLLAVWMLYTLVLRNAYLSELFSILQDGRTRTSLQTVDELIEKNYTFYVHYTVEDMAKDSTKPTNVKIVYNYKDLFYVMFIRTQNESETVAIPCYEDMILYYNQNKSREPLYLLPEKLFTVPLTMYLSKHSFLLHKINEILMDILSSGLIQKFKDIYLDKKYWLQNEAHIPQALSVWLFFGIFSLYLVLLLLCIFVFFLELYSRRSTFLNNILDFFNA